MTNGMKSGAGSDPFADSSSESDEESSEATDAADVADSNAPGSTEHVPESGSGQVSNSDEESVTDPAEPAPDESLPYLFDRDGVKDDRRMVQYFLRETTVELETQSQRAIEDELGTDVYLTDLREALVRVGAANLDEVAEELRAWGYRFEED